ncbi:MAG: DNA gyrase subunit A, partial [Bacteroidales bacterium]|nr:DNA gyrase subunit A [Bacteroidales bacterium]
LPYTVTTDVLIDSILKANEKGKIKIKKVDDNTAAEVEIVVYLPAGVSPDQTIDALYAFTSCQISFSPQTCVIVDDKPVFMTASDILRHNTFRTRDLLRQELEIQLAELEDRWHWVSLEKIFFEKGIYKKMEQRDSLSWDEQVDDMHRAFGPYKKHFKRDITRDDILKLTEKPVRKISKFDIKRAEEEIESIEMTIDEVRNHLAHLTDYAIRYFEGILKKFGKGRERRTEIRSFEDIESTSVALANEKLYVNYTTGFAGWGLKREEGVEVACECSRLDDIIAFRRDGTFVVTKIQEKGFVGSQNCPEILFISVFRKRDERTVYNMIYRDGGPDGYVMVKRFSVTSITRDKEYLLTKGTRGSKVLYFTANPNGEAEVVTVHHVSKPKLKKTSFDFDFKTLAIKGRQSMGNILTRNAVRSINLKDEGISTLSARKIWFDESVKRLNVNEAGRYLGEFRGSDKILAVTQSAIYRTTTFDLANHYDDDLIELRKFSPDAILTALYRSPDGHPYLKRFVPEPSDRKIPFLDPDGSSLISICMDYYPRLEVVYNPDSGKKIPSEIIDVEEFIGVKSHKAKGKRITTFAVDSFNWLAPLKPDPEPEPEPDPLTSDLQPPASDLPDDRMGFAEGTQTQLF